MTIKELIASLRICSNHEIGCAGCHFEEDTASCLSKLTTEAANRLEELAAKNERLKWKATTNCDDWVDD
jgi:hypothetical protein